VRAADVVGAVASDRGTGTRWVGEAGSSRCCLNRCRSAIATRDVGRWVIGPRWPGACSSSRPASHANQLPTGLFDFGGDLPAAVAGPCLSGPSRDWSRHRYGRNCGTGVLPPIPPARPVKALLRGRERRRGTPGPRLLPQRNARLSTTSARILVRSGGAGAGGPYAELRTGRGSAGAARRRRTGSARGLLVSRRPDNRPCNGDRMRLTYRDGSTAEGVWQDARFSAATGSCTPRAAARSARHRPLPVPAEGVEHHSGRSEAYPSIMSGMTTEAFGLAIHNRLRAGCRGPCGHRRQSALSPHEFQSSPLGIKPTQHHTSRSAPVPSMITNR
jgi:hypothetical protein